VLIGFPQEEGIRRNHGRPGAAQAPDEIRRWLYRLTPADCEAGLSLGEPALVDLGNLRIVGTLEDTQEALAQVVAAVLAAGAIPVILGGGHETAYGHFQGYVTAERSVAIINIDAHLDVRPTLDGRGHSGSPFRQALEHPTHPLPGNQYVCLGAQPQSVSRDHCRYLRERGGQVRWYNDVRHSLEWFFREEGSRRAAAGCAVYVSLDADVVGAAEVPGVSAPNPNGLEGREVLACARLAGSLPWVTSFDLVEISPPVDRDSQSTRWAALVVWNFLMGLSLRSSLSAAQ
jgi:formiminoglutamase